MSVCPVSWFYYDGGGRGERCLESFLIYICSVTTHAVSWYCSLDNIGHARHHPGSVVEGTEQAGHAESFLLLQRPKPEKALALVRMIEVKKSPQFSSQTFNFKPGDSMAECHAKRVKEKIAEKKAESNVEKLDHLVDQLKRQLESKETVSILFSGSI